MGEHNSPYYAAGIEDATRDACLVSSCPPQPAVGYDPDKDWSSMYRRGYERTFVEGWHEPCDNCKRQQEAS